MLKFRGNGSVAEYEKLVPICVLMLFTPTRVSYAMTSYVPLASRVFTSPFS